MAKKLLLTTILTGLMALSSCGGNGLIKPDYKSEGVHIGILKYVNDAPLNEAESAFLEELNRQGISYFAYRKDGNADANIVASAALNIVSNCNLLVAIATPAATAVMSARDTKSRMIPTLFTAVTDPVSAGLVKSNTQTDQNVTGTSDMNPVAEQIQLFKDLNPNASKIGIIYNLNESNSVIQYNLAKAKCEELHMTLENGGFNAASDILATINSLIGKGIEGLYIPTDNTAVSNLTTIKQKTDEARIPIVAGEGTVVVNGAIISRSLSYAELGKKTAQQAIRIINGEDVINIPVSTADNFPLYINVTHANELGITIPQTLIDEANAHGGTII